jgi:type I restriction enzyme, S subunit
MRTDWTEGTIGDVCTIVNGGTPKSEVIEFWDGPHQWITPAEMGKRSSPYVASSRRTISDEGLRNSSARLLPPHSVILSSRAPIGHLVINTEPMSTNQGCKGLIPCDSLHYKFLYYFLASSVEMLNELGSGTTFKELSGSKLKEVSIPVPPMAEQRRIVGILDEAFAGIATAKANAERNLQNARALFESHLEFAFAKGEGKWVERKVQDIAAKRKGSIRTGPFGSQLLHSEFVETGVAVLGIDNAVANEFRWGKDRFITQEKYLQLKRYTVFPGDVLITIMGTCGRCAIVPTDIPTAINTKHLCCITLDHSQCLPEFLHLYFLHAPRAKAFLAMYAKGAIMAGLNMGLIQDLPVLLPPLDVQAAISQNAAAVLAQTQQLHGIAKQKTDSLIELRNALLRDAFAGEL